MMEGAPGLRGPASESLQGREMLWGGGEDIAILLI